jgi:hypothetical protein
MADEDDKKSQVGYGRPPRHTRFGKGRSGNPRGRPRGSTNPAALLQQALNELVFITENGQRRRITKGEAIYKQLVNKGASGDARAIQLLLGAIRGLAGELETAPGGDGSAADPLVQQQRADEEELTKLRRLTVPERAELRRLLAKMEGRDEAVEIDPLVPSPEK